MTEFTDEEVDELLTVLDTYLEEGYEVEGVDADVLETAHEKLEASAE